MQVGDGGYVEIRIKYSPRWQVTVKQGSKDNSVKFQTYACQVIGLPRVYEGSIVLKTQPQKRRRAGSYTRIAAAVVRQVHKAADRLAYAAFQVCKMKGA